MPLPFALSLPQIVAALGVGAAAIAAGAPSETQREIKKARIRRARIVGPLAGGTGASSSGPTLPTGPLPRQALEAWNAKKKGKSRTKLQKLRRSAFGPKNDIHKKDAWFRFGTYSKRGPAKKLFRDKIDKLRYYSDPSGALFVRKSGDAARAGNLCWMARCPRKWYPGFGRAKTKNIRLPGLKPWLGPKADWNSVKGAFKKSIQDVPAVLKAAAVVVAGIYSGGSSLTKNSGKQVDTVHDGVVAAFAPFKDAKGSAQERTEMAYILVTAIRKQYIAQIMDANPWLVKDGKLDIGPNYMSDPKTWEDLGKPGKSYPLIYNPPVSK